MGDLGEEVLRRDQGLVEDRRHVHDRADVEPPDPGRGFPDPEDRPALPQRVLAEGRLIIGADLRDVLLGLVLHEVVVRLLLLQLPQRQPGPGQRQPRTR